MAFSLGGFEVKSFKADLQEKMLDPSFKSKFNKYYHLINFAFVINKRRKALGITQEQLAKISGLTLKQVSKIEDADNAGYSVVTLFKVLDALGLEIQLKEREKK